MADFYLERMKAEGKLRGIAIELINRYSKKLDDGLTFHQSEKSLDIFNNNGLVSRLIFDLIPRIEIKQENYPLNNDLILGGFYRIE